MLKNKKKKERNRMGNSVSVFLPRKAAVAARGMTTGLCLHTPRGARKYLTRGERQRVLAVMAAELTDADLFGLTLAWTGARVSEVLALTREAFDVEAGLVTLRTLKRRKPSLRQVPLPADLLALLDSRFGVAAGEIEGRLWPFDRTTAWRHVKRRVQETGLTGLAACPRGFRHGFGVGTLQSGVPLTLLQRWLGHARLTTTAIYAEVSGPEERGFADKFKRWSEAG